MKDQEGLPTKTVLEYLVMINHQSYSGIGRELNITPQQFSDWIKQRRPIPRERLKALTDYFGVHGTNLVDGQQYAKQLTPVAKSELQMLLLDQKIVELEMEGAEDEDIAPYREKKQQLQGDQKNQILLTRMAALLEMNDERVGTIMDIFFNKLSAGHLDELIQKLNEIR